VADEQNVTPAEETVASDPISDDNDSSEVEQNPSSAGDDDSSQEVPGAAEPGTDAPADSPVADPEDGDSLPVTDGEQPAVPAEERDGDTEDGPVASGTGDSPNVIDVIDEAPTPVDVPEQSAEAAAAAIPPENSGGTAQPGAMDPGEDSPLGASGDGASAPMTPHGTPQRPFPTAGLLATMQIHQPSGTASAIVGLLVPGIAIYVSPPSTLEPIKGFRGSRVAGPSALGEDDIGLDTGFGGGMVFRPEPSQADDPGKPSKRMRSKSDTAEPHDGREPRPVPAGEEQESSSVPPETERSSFRAGEETAES
jgi:hypothetical protein